MFTSNELIQGQLTERPVCLCAVDRDGSRDGSLLCGLLLYQYSFSGSLSAGTINTW